ncbi:MAG: NAD-dependent epimerase/dehydratase family protein, partial [Vulcanimicrobiaceae bacterium]
MLRSKRTVLVTGATGFVGSNIVRRFADAGDQIIALDRVGPDTAVKKYLSAFREH